MGDRKYLKISISLNIVLAILLFNFGFKDMVKLFKHFNKSEQTKVIMFGNSITAYGNWNELLNRDDILNKGFPGFTSSHLLKLHQENVIAYKPELCFIMVGINDIQYGIPMDRIKSNYTLMLENMIKDGIKPIVQSVIYMVNNHNSKVLIDSLNNFLYIYCAQNKIQYLDLNEKLSDSAGLKPENSIDGVHLSKRAYETWAAEIEQILALNLVDPDKT